MSQIGRSPYDSLEHLKHSWAVDELLNLLEHGWSCYWNFMYCCSAFAFVKILLLSMNMAHSKNCQQHEHWQELVGPLEKCDVDPVLRHIVAQHGGSNVFSLLSRAGTPFVTTTRTTTHTNAMSTYCFMQNAAPSSPSEGNFKRRAPVQ